jgi:hypothetical protein
MAIQIAPYGLPVHEQHDGTVLGPFVEMMNPQIGAVVGLDGGIARGKRVIG